MSSNTIYIGSKKASFETKEIKGKPIEFENEDYYKISNSDAMRPFFMSIVSDSNHWMFISSNGGVTAGRKNAEYALFPYYTDDKITEFADITGSKSIFQIRYDDQVVVWEPYSERFNDNYNLTRNLYKNLYGNKVIFEEINNDLLLNILFIIGVTILSGLLTFLMRQTIIVMSRLIEYDMRKEIFEHYQILDLAFYKRNKTGDLMARITEDVNKVRMYLGPAILYGINLVSLFAFVIYAMVNVSLELTLFVFIFIPISGFIITKIGKSLKSKSQNVQKENGYLISIVEESLSGLKVVKSYNAENSFIQKFNDSLERLLKLQKSV